LEQHHHQLGLEVRIDHQIILKWGETPYRE
jgi:hypothetical protein